MEENFSKNSSEQQDYNEIKDMLSNLLLDLFKTMLDYKNIQYVGEENNFEYLDALVRINYPQFSQTLIHLSVLRNEPNHTYLDVIKTLLSTYIHLKDMYNDYPAYKYDLYYGVANGGTNSEIIFFSGMHLVPIQSELDDNGIKINFRKA